MAAEVNLLRIGAGIEGAGGVALCGLVRRESPVRTGHDRDDLPAFSPYRSISSRRLVRPPAAPSTAPPLALAPSRLSHAHTCTSGPVVTASPPAVETVVSVTAEASGRRLSNGTVSGAINARTTHADARTAAKSRLVVARAGNTMILEVRALPADAEIRPRVRIGQDWQPLPAVEVGTDGSLVLPALTFSRAGT